MVMGDMSADIPMDELSLKVQSIGYIYAKYMVDASYFVTVPSQPPPLFGIQPGYLSEVFDVVVFPVMTTLSASESLVFAVSGLLCDSAGSVVFGSLFAVDSVLIAGSDSSSGCGGGLLSKRSS